MSATLAELLLSTSATPTGSALATDANAIVPAIPRMENRTSLRELVAMTTPLHPCLLARSVRARCWPKPSRSHLGIGSTERRGQYRTRIPVLSRKNFPVVQINCGAPSRRGRAFATAECPFTWLRLTGIWPHLRTSASRQWIREPERIRGYGSAAASPFDRFCAH